MKRIRGQKEKQKRIRGGGKKRVRDNAPIFCLVCGLLVESKKHGIRIPADAKNPARYRCRGESCEPGSENWANKYPDSFLGRYFYKKQAKDKRRKNKSRDI